jgi:hypothetical protein
MLLSALPWELAFSPSAVLLECYVAAASVGFWREANALVVEREFNNLAGLMHP